MMKSTLIKDLYGEIERLKAGKSNRSVSVDRICRGDKCTRYKVLCSDLFYLFLLEVYASREKNGVYMPKERYYQEESERKVLSF